MYSRGHFLLKWIAIYQNVCFDEQFSKIVPANFSIKFQGQDQRPKVTTLKYSDQVITT